MGLTIPIPPTEPISTEYLNAETDDPNLARIDLEKLALSHNAMIESYGVANGFAMLDAEGKLSTAVFDKENILAALSGTNTGLDADTLDGLDSASFVRIDGTQAMATSQTQNVTLTSLSGTGVSTIFRFANKFNGTTTAGFGGSLGFDLSQSTGQVTRAAYLDVEWITPTTSAATAAIAFETIVAGTMEKSFKYYNRRLEMTELVVTPPTGPTAGSGKWWLYFLPAGLFIKDDTGTEIQIGAGTTLDHGSLLGRGDDDHTQYLLVDGSRAMTGNLLLGSNLLRFTDRTTPGNPPAGQVYLYSKGQGLYYKLVNGTEVGPLGTGGTGGGGSTTHAALTDLTLNLDDHKQYLLRQPTADVVINASGGDFNFRIAGDLVDPLFFLDAGVNSVGIGAQPTGLGRFEVTAGAGYGIGISSTTQSSLVAVSASGTTITAQGQAQVISASRNVSGVPTVAVMQVDELGTAGFRVLDVNGRASTDTMRVRVGSIDAFRLTGTGAVFNDSQGVYEFTIRSLSNAAVFSVDSVANSVKVGINVGAPAALNVGGGNLHGIYALTQNASKNAIWAEAYNAAIYALKVTGGVVGGRGQGISVATVVDEAATFLKNLSGAAVATYAVQINVASGSDTAHALHVLNSGTGDILRCEGPFATTNHYPLRVLSAGGTIWEYRATDLTPPTGSFALYFKSDGLYVKPAVGSAVGPLGTGGTGTGVTTHAALTDLALQLNDHPQYVLRQPIANTIINQSNGDFDFTIRGAVGANNNMFCLDAGNMAVGINVVPSTTGRLELDAGGRYGFIANSTTLPAILATSTTGNTIWTTGQNTCLRASRSVSSAPAGAMVSFEELGTAGNRVLDVLGKSAVDVMQVKVGTITALNIKAAQMVVNDSQSTYDFLIRSAGLSQLFAASATGNALYVGTTVAGGATINVNSGALHGLYILNTNASKNAGIFEQRATGYGVNIIGGSGGDGLGGGIQASSVREGCASFTKTLGGAAVAATSAVGIYIPASGTETAHALEINNQGTGDHINCGNASAYVFRLLQAGGTIWNDIATDPTPPTGSHSLYFKNGGLYVKASVAAGGAITGPLGTGGTGSSTHAGLTDLAVQNDDHAQYVLRQPTVAKPTIINNSAGDFDFVVKGLSHATLFTIDAGLGVVTVNGTAAAMSTTLGRFQVIEFGTNPAITAASLGTSIYTSTSTGLAFQAVATDAGQAAKLIRNSAVLSLTPAVLIQDGNTTIGTLTLDVVQVMPTANIAIFRHFGSTSKLMIGGGEVVVNDDAAAAYNFRVEGAATPDLLRVQGGNNSVGINCVPSTSARMAVVGGGRTAMTVDSTTSNTMYVSATTGTALLLYGEGFTVFDVARNTGSTPNTAAVVVTEQGTAGNRLLDLNGLAATDVMRVKVGTTVPLFIRGTWTTFNDSASNHDFIIKGTTAMELFAITAASNVVSINGVLTTARLNVQGGTLHGIYSTITSSTKNAALFEQRGDNWCVSIQGGNITGGLGSGLEVITVRSSSANFTKVLLGEAVGADYVVNMAVADPVDTATVLRIRNDGTGDYFQCHNAAFVQQFRIPTGGGTIWRDLASDMAVPAANYHSLYFKSDGLYVRSPAGVVGPLGVGGGGGTAGALSAITAAVAANTIANGSNAQSWTWNLGSTTNTAFTISETAAATGFSSLLKVVGVASSLATTFTVTNDPTGRTFYIENGLSRINSRRISLGTGSLWLTPQSSGYDEVVGLTGDYSPNPTYSTLTRFTVFNTSRVNMKFAAMVTNEDPRHALMNFHGVWDAVGASANQDVGYSVDAIFDHKSMTWRHGSAVCGTVDFTNRVAGGMTFASTYEARVRGWTNANSTNYQQVALFFFRAGQGSSVGQYLDNTYAMPTTGAQVMLYGLKFPEVTMGDYEQWRPLHILGLSGISGHMPRMAIGAERSIGEWWGFTQHASLSLLGYSDRPGATTRHFDDEYILAMLEGTPSVGMAKDNTYWRAAFWRTGAMRLWPSAAPNSYWSVASAGAVYAYVSTTRFSVTVDESAKWLTGRKIRFKTTASAGAWVYTTVASYDAAATPDQVVVAAAVLDSGFTTPQYEDAEGSIYINSTDHKLYYHNGTAWTDLTTGGGGGGGGWQDDGTIVRLSTISDQVLLGASTTAMLGRLVIKGENSVYDRVGVIVLPWDGSTANSFEVRDSTGGYVMASIGCGYSVTGQMQAGIRATGFFRLQHYTTDGSQNLTSTVNVGEFLGYSTGAKIVIGGLNSDFNTGNGARNLLIISNGVGQSLTPGNAVTFFAKDESGLGANYSFPKFRAEDGRDRTIIGADTHTFTLSTGVGNVKMAGTTTRNNDGFLQINREDGVLIQIPYWITITG